MTALKSKLTPLKLRSRLTATTQVFPGVPLLPSLQVSGAVSCKGRATAK